MRVSREPLPKIKQLSSDACKTLDTWKQSYLEVRKRIEQSGRDARWEFDRKKLFDRSDYIAQICNDIHSVAQVCTHVYMYTQPIISSLHFLLILSPPLYVFH